MESWNLNEPSVLNESRCLAWEKVFIKWLSSSDYESWKTGHHCVLQTSLVHQDWDPCRCVVSYVLSSLSCYLTYTKVWMKDSSWLALSHSQIFSFDFNFCWFVFSALMRSASDDLTWFVLKCASVMEHGLPWTCARALSCNECSQRCFPCCLKTSWTAESSLSWSAQTTKIR